jgi:hypothetical protein
MPELGTERRTYSMRITTFRETVRLRAGGRAPLSRLGEAGHFPRRPFRKAGAPESFRPACRRYGAAAHFLHHVILHEEMGYSLAGAAWGQPGIDGSSY